MGILGDSRFCEGPSCTARTEQVMQILMFEQGTALWLSANGPGTTSLANVRPSSTLCVRVGSDEYTDKVANALADFPVRLNATRERLAL